jgi:hypothetical protein
MKTTKFIKNATFTPRDVFSEVGKQRIKASISHAALTEASPSLCTSY